MRSEPSRVAFVIGGLGSGGSETQLTELLLHVHPHSIRAEVVVLVGGPSPRRARLEAHGIRVWEIRGSRRRGAPYAAFTAMRVMRQLARLRPDVVYAWLEESAVLAAPSAWALGVPLVVARRNVIGSQLEQRGAPFRAIVQGAERRAAVVTANSEAGRHFAISRGIDPERIRVVYNGHAEVPVLPPSAEHPFTFGYLAQFRPEKGHARLLEVLRHVSPDVALRVVLGGSGPLLEETKRVATSLVAGRVEFAGAVDDVRSFWGRCHAALLLSDHEGQPNSLIEAALAGRAALATDVGGTPEVVLPDGGFVVAPDDHAGAAAQMQRLAGEPGLAEQLGAAAYGQARERFSMQASVDGHLAAIAAALRSR
jgi:glycosyltransferase involved in cell wall biosynthesis